MSGGDGPLSIDAFKASSQSEKQLKLASHDVPLKSEEMVKGGGLRRKVWLGLTSCLLLAGLVLATSGLVTWSLHTGREERFLILLDAGSVHTSVYTYRYSFTEPDNVTITETHFCELGETGISSFQDNPREAARFVSSSSCVRDSVERIPAERRSQSRLELLSTAGMRVLRLKSPAVAEEILGNLTQELGQVGDMQAEAGILSGVEEAVAGWLTSVELSGEVVGALDWGGASSQLTVPDRAGDHTVTVGGREVRLTATSHLCYGQAESLKRHRAGLVTAAIASGDIDLDSQLSFNVTDPCLPSGSSIPDLSLPSLFSSPCTRLADTSLLSTITASPALITFTSHPDYDRCSALVLAQFSPALCDLTWQTLQGEVSCLDPASISPPTNLTYLAMSTYWYLLDGLGLGEEVTMAQYLNSTQEVCALNISSAEAQLGRVSRIACYQCLLMYHLLTSGYHFNSSSWQQIRPVKRINEAEVGWGLGHAMMEANTLDLDPTISLALMIGLVTGGLVLLLVGLTMAVKDLATRELYSRLGERV